VTEATILLGVSDTLRYYAPMTTPAPALMTADDLLRLQPPDKRTELVRGRMIVREPAGFRHGDVAMAIALLMGPFVKANNLGRVLAAETGFVLFTNPDTVRAPDVSFVRHEKIPDPLPKGYAPFSPDLAVEVLSPDDRSGEVLEKVGDWLNAGTLLVWIVDPEKRNGRVHRADGSVTVIAESESFDGEEVLPGFTCPLREIF
jgi:Uma2 family endonuclease